MNSREHAIHSNPLPAPEQKVTYVRAMFGRIAQRYDLMNRLVSLGRDRAWRRYAVTAAALRPDSRVLDMATGTGDLAFEALRQHPGLQVVGVDLTPEMIRVARRKAAAAGNDLALVVGDAMRLPFADATFDGVLTGFALRNVVDIPTAFVEMARVTGRGGRVSCLEIAKPRSASFRRLFSFYFYRIVPLIGALVAGQRMAYTYLPHSLTAFPSPEEIAEVMKTTGWDDVTYRRLTLGTSAVHSGTRQPASS